MSTPDSSDIFQYAVPGGAITLRAQFQTFAGSGFQQVVSGTTIAITAVIGGAVIVATTSAGITSPDSAAFTFTWSVATSVAPGDYAVLWSATGPSGTLTIPQTVTIASFPAQTPSPGVYATAAQYTAWSGDSTTPPAIVAPALRRASEVIDLYTIGAVYATNANSMPSDPPVIDAFMRATCAQCQFELAQNDPSLVKSQYASTSMGGVGGVAQTRAKGATMQTMPPLAPRAAAIMRTVGILPSAPLISW